MMPISFKVYSSRNFVCRLSKFTSNQCGIPRGFCVLYILSRTSNFFVESTCKKPSYLLLLLLLLSLLLLLLLLLLFLLVLIMMMLLLLSSPPPSLCLLYFLGVQLFYVVIFVVVAVFVVFDVVDNNLDIFLLFLVSHRPELCFRVVKLLFNKMESGSMCL